MKLPFLLANAQILPPFLCAPDSSPPALLRTLYTWFSFLDPNLSWKHISPIKKKKKKKKLHYSIQTQPSTPGTCLFSQLSWELPIFTVTNHLHLATFPGYFSLAFDTVNLFPSLKDTPLSGCVIRHSRGYSFFGYHTLSDIEILDFLKFGPRL